MNSKAIRKQLLAAVAMVLVAAVALGSSTYAWFVASGTVKAEGMSVKAQSEGGLAIRWAGQASQLWGTTASANMTSSAAASLRPTSTYDLRHWSHATASQETNSTAKAGSYTDVTKIVLGEQGNSYQANNGYVLMQPFEIRSTSADRHAKGLYVSAVNVSDATHDLDCSLRVGVRLTPKGDNPPEVAYIYAPVADATTTYSWTNGTATHSVPLEEIGTASNDKSNLVSRDTDIPHVEGDAIDVEIYIWYEGEDGKLYTKNYIDTALSVSVEFSSYSFVGDTKVDLTSGVTVAESATNAISPAGVADTPYYKISGKTGTAGETLYSNSTTITKDSIIVTIDGTGKATQYTNVKLPTT